MKIGLFNDSFPPTIDGVANTMINYAQILHGMGDNVTVVTPKYPNVVDEYPFSVFRYSSIPAKFVRNLPYRVGNPFSPVTVRKVYKMGFDIMHIHSPFVSSLLVNQVLDMSHKEIPLVITYHTKYDVDIKRYLAARNLQKLLERIILGNLKKADEIWAVSRGTIDSLRALGYKGDVQIMPNGTDFPKGKAPQAEVDEIDRVYRTGNEELVFLYCGRMMWYKNLKIILDALQILKNEDVNYKMFFVGDAPDRPSVEEYARKHGLMDRLIFTGAITDRERVRAFFSRADLLLFPSTYDTAGLVVKEAAACECPSALIAGSCAAEGVDDGSTGILAGEENAESFARALLDAVRQPGLLKQLGQNAQRHIYSSWEDSIALARARYDVVVQEKKEKLAASKKKGRSASGNKAKPKKVASVQTAPKEKSEQ